MLEEPAQGSLHLLGLGVISKTARCRVPSFRGGCGLPSALHVYCVGGRGKNRDRR